MDLNSPTFLIYFFVVLFLIVFVTIYVFNLRKVKKKKFDTIGELNYVIKKFHLEKKRINYKKEICMISFLDSLIIASVGTFVTSLEIAIFLQLGLGFLLLRALIYALFEIYGRHLLRKLGEDKNEF